MQQKNVLLDKSTYPWGGGCVAPYNMASVCGQIQKILGTSFLPQNNLVCSNVRDKDINTTHKSAPISP